jgi:hypothetical protein
MATEIAPGAPASHGNAGKGAHHRAARTLPWWLLPVAVVTVLGAFSVYAIWTAVLGHDEYGPYVSPFTSPQFITNFFNGRFAIPSAFFVLWSPLAFRGTCYYYRKSYYRSFFWDPPACGVGELRHKGYRGEARFPMIFNNLHRFFLYPALIVVGFLWYDAVESLMLGGRFYLGVGSAIMLVNVVLLSGYTFGCHSLRHLSGGGLDCYSCVRGGAARHGLWRAITVLNGRHAMWAWVSMFSVAFTDMYIRMLQAGWFADPHVSF